MLRSGTAVEADGGFLILLIITVGFCGGFCPVCRIHFEGGVSLAAVDFNGVQREVMKRLRSCVEDSSQRRIFIGNLENDIRDFDRRISSPAVNAGSAFFIVLFC